MKKIWTFVIVFIVIVSVIVWRNQHKGAAEEYYNIMLSRNPIKFQNVPVKLQLIEDGKLIKYSGKDSIHETNKALRYLLDEVITASGHKSIHQDNIYIGIYPLQTVNARTFKTPNGGILILVNSGLLQALYVWFDMINRLAIPNTSHYQEKVDVFISSLKDFYKSGRIPQYKKWPIDRSMKMIEQQIEELSKLLTSRALLFVIAHEYAHILLGHIDLTHNDSFMLGNKRFMSEEYWKKEVECDRMAANILLGHPDSSKEMQELKATTIIATAFIFSSIESSASLQVKPLGKHDTWPQFYYRLGEIKKYLEQHKNIPDNPLYNSIAITLNYVQHRSFALRKPNVPPKEEEYRYKFWIAQKQLHREEQANLIKASPDKFKKWAFDLIETSILLPEIGIESSVYDWSDGDSFKSFDLCALAIVIDSVFQDTTGKKAVTNLKHKVDAVIESLISAGTRFEQNGLYTTAKQIRHEADRLEKFYKNNSTNSNPPDRRLLQE